MFARALDRHRAGRLQDAADAHRRVLELEPRHHGALGHLGKVHDALLFVRAQVLARVPESRLVLLAPQGRARARVLERFAVEGVAAERVEFVSRMPERDYLRTYERKGAINCPS